MTKDIVTITGKEVERIAYRGVPVITLRMMDELKEWAEENGYIPENDEEEDDESE